MAPLKPSILANDSSDRIMRASSVLVRVEVLVLELEEDVALVAFVLLLSVLLSKLDVFVVL